MQAPVTKNVITDALNRAGLPRGSNVLVHSSLSSMGRVEGGSDAVIDGILDQIGPEGTLMVPTFNYWAVDLFDPRTTPGLTGLVAETLRQRQGAVRSLHPTHSVAAIGKRAGEFTEGHERVGAMRIHSPIDKLAKAGGYTLLLGVRHDSNSTVHVGESYAAPWYLGFPFSPTDPAEANILVESSVITARLAGFQSGCSIAFNAIELPLREHGEIVDFRIGAALCQLMPAQAIIDRTFDLIRERDSALLCSWADCFFCSNALRHRP
jgi:aminoglycoside 3-N-acetyltransferase